MGVSDFNKGTFLSRRKGDIFIEARHLNVGHLSCLVRAIIYLTDATVTANLRAVKDAWRNPTMHVDIDYDEEKATDVWKWSGKYIIALIRVTKNVPEAQTKMTKTIGVLFLGALGCSASMIPGGACAVGSYDEYAALGAAGCTIEGRLFYNFASNVVPAPLSTLPLTITPNDSGSDTSVGLTFAGTLPLTASNPSIAVEYSVLATSATLITRTGASFTLGSMSTGQGRLALLVSPLSSSLPASKVIETPSFAAKTETLLPVISSYKRADIADVALIDVSPTDFTVQSFTTTFLNVPSDPQVAAPEPGTLACAGLGILLLLACKIMARPKS